MVVLYIGCGIYDILFTLWFGVGGRVRLELEMGVDSYQGKD